MVVTNFRKFHQRGIAHGPLASEKKTAGDNIFKAMYARIVMLRFENNDSCNNLQTVTAVTYVHKTHRNGRLGEKSCDNARGITTAEAKWSPANTEK